VRKLRFTGAIVASDNAAGSPQHLRLEGKGQLNGAPFELTSQGDRLMTAELQQPYNFSVELRAASTRLKVQSQIARPFDLGSLTAAFAVSGRDLADVYYLTGLTLPNTPPYSLSGQLQVQGTQISLSRLSGTLGNSDVRGTMQIQMGTRPKMSADLASRSLDMADLAPAFGAEPRNKSAQEPVLERAGESSKNGVNGAGSADGHIQEKQTDKGLLLPDAKLDLNRIRGMDADVRYQAQSIKEQKIPFKEVSWHLQLSHGVLTINPLSFVLPQGKVTGRLRIDASRDVPEDEVDLRLSQVDLAEFHPKDGPPPLNGSLLARVAIHGRGQSVHDVAATADGAMTIVVPHGEIRSAFAELTGVNVARGLGLLLTKNQQQSEVRCAMADFKSRQGVLTAQNIVMDTQNVRITGKGDINLRDETLNLQIDGQPKKIRLLAIRSPIVVRGTLRKPSVDLEPGHLAKQGAEAAALGALATPLAAILAFVDPGLAKDADCGALLQEAQHSSVPIAPTARAQSPASGTR
jgi:AsmA family protein